MKRLFLIMVALTLWLLTFGTCSAFPADFPMELKMHPWYQKQNPNGAVIWLVSTDPVIEIDYDITAEKYYEQRRDELILSGIYGDEAHQLASRSAREYAAHPENLNKQTVQFWMGYVAKDNHTYFRKYSVDLQEFTCRVIRTYDFVPNTNKLIGVYDDTHKYRPWKILASLPHVQEALTYLIDNHLGVFKEMGEQ